MATTQLLANYKSPTSTQTISFELPPDKTAYLSALRAKAVEMQSEINTFLTQKMMEDKAVEAGKVDQKEEENYGEEDPEGDA
ncbi:hypothetical protein PRZ48_001504 [Zasmidium cellare]|uniref:EKC/KEOPS complex subunit GON7 n=1 Tax=Zasmidium cellare TaxID=395010 RepID=A0ABR0F1F9_ZASCE|nr:hypothetical protein PRZ48_001504 [Zasmidium cellare]